MHICVKGLHRVSRILADLKKVSLTIGLTACPERNNSSELS